MDGAKVMPAISASLNATAMILLIVGLVLIKLRRTTAHRNVMIAAFAVSSLFLVNYLIYHASYPPVKFAGEGWSRPVYYAILFTHIPLAVTVPVLAIASIRFGLRGELERHKKWTKWTMPIWLYVSVTGVLVYFFLYQWFPATGA